MNNTKKNRLGKTLVGVSLSLSLFFFGQHVLGASVGSSGRRKQCFRSGQSDLNG